MNAHPPALSGRLESTRKTGADRLKRRAHRCRQRPHGCNCAKANQRRDQCVLDQILTRLIGQKILNVLFEALHCVLLLVSVATYEARTRVTGQTWSHLPTPTMTTRSYALRHSGQDRYQNQRNMQANPPPPQQNHPNGSNQIAFPIHPIPPCPARIPVSVFPPRPSPLWLN